MIEKLQISVFYDPNKVGNREIVHAIISRLYVWHECSNAGELTKVHCEMQTSGDPNAHQHQWGIR